MRHAQRRVKALLQRAKAEEQYTREHFGRCTCGHDLTQHVFIQKGYAPGFKGMRCEGNGLCTCIQYAPKQEKECPEIP